MVVVVVVEERWGFAVVCKRKWRGGFEEVVLGREQGRGGGETQVRAREWVSGKEFVFRDDEVDGGGTVFMASHTIIMERFIKLEKKL